MTPKFLLLPLIMCLSSPVQGEGYTIPRAAVPLTEHPLRHEQPWQTGPYCGANSLFVFLNLCGIHVSVDDLRKHVPATGKGASLADLKTAAENRGLDVEVMKVAPAGLRNQSLPFVALMGDDVATDGGHYVVVCAIDDDGVWAVDGTTGSVVGLPTGTFNRLFSGYFLSRARKAFSLQSDSLRSARLCVQAVMWLCAGEAAVLLGLAVWWWFRRLPVRDKQGRP